MACGGDDAAAPADAAADAPADGADATTTDQYIAPADASKTVCTLEGDADPVFLCTQKLVLRTLHDSALATGKGLVASWDSITGIPDMDDAGAPAHDVHDDAAYTAACGNYARSASRYGDTELTAVLLADLTTLAPILRDELATLPDEYAGRLYFHLRDTAVGLRYAGQNDLGTSFDSLADAAGAKIFAHFVPLSAPDGGTDAGDDGGADGGDEAGDAGTDAGAFTLPGAGVLAGDSTNVDYAPGDGATGALALLDMAVRHAADDPTHAGGWALAAVESLEHAYLRGRDGATGLYFRLLVPSSAPAHDDLSPRAPAPSDLLATEATGDVALALFRAAELVTANATLAPISPIATYPFVDRANAALAALNGAAPLFDGDAGGYAEGTLATNGALLPNKPTRANALLLAALHRANVLRVTPFTRQAQVQRTVLGATSPRGASLLTVVPGQSAFFAAVAKDFTLPPSDAGLPVAHPNSFVTAATLSAIDAFNDQWNGDPNAP